MRTGSLGTRGDMLQQCAEKVHGLEGRVTQTLGLGGDGS
jgi:hypothetical protein